MSVSAPWPHRYAKLRVGLGGYSLTYFDEFIDDLLTKDRVCDIILPRLTQRSVLEETEGLPPRKSLLVSLNSILHPLHESRGAGRCSLTCTDPHDRKKTRTNLNENLLALPHVHPPRVTRPLTSDADALDPHRPLNPILAAMSLALLPGVGVEACPSMGRKAIREHGSSVGVRAYHQIESSQQWTRKSSRGTYERLYPCIPEHGQCCTIHYALVMSYTYPSTTPRYRLGRPNLPFSCPILASSSTTLSSNLPAFPSIELSALRCAPRIAESWLIGSSPSPDVGGWEEESVLTSSIIDERLREMSSSCLLRSSASA